MEKSFVEDLEIYKMGNHILENTDHQPESISSLGINIVT